MEKTTTRKKTTKKSVNNSSNGNSKNKITLGVVAAMAVIGSAAYYFYGSRRAEEHREKMVAWFQSARDEVSREARKLKDAAFNKQNYMDIAKSVGNRYRDLKKFDSKDVIDFVKVVAAEWEHLSNKIKAESRKVKRKVKKVGDDIEDVAEEV